MTRGAAVMGARGKGGQRACRAPSCCLTLLVPALVASALAAERGAAMHHHCLLQLDWLSGCCSHRGRERPPLRPPYPCDLVQTAFRLLEAVPMHACSALLHPAHACMAPPRATQQPVRAPSVQGVADPALVEAPKAGGKRKLREQLCSLRGNGKLSTSWMCNRARHADQL